MSGADHCLLHCLAGLQEAGQEGAGAKIEFFRLSVLRQVSRLRHELRAAPAGRLWAADSNETVEIGLHNDCSTLSSNAAQEIAITVFAVSSAGAVCPRPSGKFSIADGLERLAAGDAYPQEVRIVENVPDRSYRRGDPSFARYFHWPTRLAGSGNCQFDPPVCCLCKPAPCLYPDGSRSTGRPPSVMFMIMAKPNSGSAARISGV